jgi:hypothetical protein
MEHKRNTAIASWEVLKAMSSLMDAFHELESWLSENEATTVILLGKELTAMEGRMAPIMRTYLEYLPPTD